jgi:hypothetical protein
VRRLSQDQTGCRLLQRRVEEGMEGLIELIVSECEAVLGDLMTDPFGNYLFQKVLAHADDALVSRILAAVSGSLERGALSMHGTRSVQKMVERCAARAASRAVVAEALGGSTETVATLARDSNGNHVLQKCLELFDAEDCGWIFDGAVAHCRRIATQRHGCCVVQRCLDAAANSKSAAARAQEAQLKRALLAECRPLMVDPYGNYVVQYIVDRGSDDDVDAVVASMLDEGGSAQGGSAQGGGRGSSPAPPHARELRPPAPSPLPPTVCRLSQQKYSSNVVEACLKRAGGASKQRLLDALCAPAALPQLIVHRYGNYVVQRAYQSGDAAQRRRMVDALRPHAAKLRETTGGRRILERIGADDPGAFAAGDDGSRAAGAAAPAAGAGGGGASPAAAGRAPPSGDGQA